MATLDGVVSRDRRLAAEQQKRQVGGHRLGKAWRAPWTWGERVIGPLGRYVLSLPTSRAERGYRNCSYLPHQGARECERRH